MLGGLIVLVVARSIVHVPQGIAYVVERLGHFDRVIGPGLHILVPFTHKVVDKMAIGQQTLEIPSLSLKSRDNVPVKIEGSTRFDVSDPERAYEAMEFRTALVQLVASEWMRAVKEADAAGITDALHAVESRIRTSATDWGLNVIRASPVVTVGEQPTQQVAPAPAAFSTSIPTLRVEEVPALTAPVFPPVASTERIQFAVASGTIAPGALGLVEADGVQWTARNLSAVEIPRGFRCIVEQQDGETLFVRCV